MFVKIVIFGTLMAFAFAELPASAPYGPSGWRPQGAPFDLPNEYFLPLSQRQTPIEIEITKQRVDFAGQISGSNAGQVAPNSAYLPPNEVDDPSGIDIIRVQGLPNRPTTQFNRFRASQLNTREYFPQRQVGQVRRQAQKFFGNFRQQQFGRQKSVPIPAAQYGAPVVQPERQYGAPIAQPATEYGAPAAELAGYPEPQKNTDNGFKFPNEENEEINDSSHVTKGEYFVLTPDKTLQKVSYQTSQTDEEAQTNAFSAQLKYTPVEEINGPLYKYNEQGQLVRIYKK